MNDITLTLTEAEHEELVIALTATRMNLPVFIYRHPEDAEMLNAKLQRMDAIIAKLDDAKTGIVLDNDLFQHTLGVLLRAHGTLERQMNGTAKDTYEVWEMTSDAYDRLVALQR